jgi:hypothetical protein
MARRKMSTEGTVKTKTNYRLEIGQTGVVYIKALKASVGDIAAALGYTEDDDQNPPQGKIVIGTNKEEALLAGCFPIAIYYIKHKKTRRAVVLCSPSKADTVANELKGKQYAKCNIVKVRPPARKKLVIG